MITKIALKNFKCFADEVIELSNLNLLTGLNGMGKSSVMQSLLLLRQNYENGLLLLQRRLGLNGEYVNIGNNLDLLYRYFDRKEVGISLDIGAGSLFEWTWSAEEPADSLREATSQLSADVGTQALFGRDFHYLNAERLGPRPYYETSSYKVVHQNQLGVRGEFAANYFSVNRENPIPIAQLKYESMDGPKEADAEVGLTLYEQVNAWLGIIRPGAKVNIDNQPDAGTTTVSYEFMVARDNPGSYKAQNVGFGLTYIFPLLVAILSSRPGTLLLIENPEAHIHPRGQAEFGVLIAKAAANGIQIILETHSDHILNGVRFAVSKGIISNGLVNLMFFTGAAVEDKFIHYIDYVKVNEKGKLSHRPQYFFDVIDEMLTKLI